MKKVGAERQTRRGGGGGGGNDFEELMKEDPVSSSIPVSRPPPLIRMDHHYGDDHAAEDGGADNRIWASSPSGCGCSSSSASFEGFLTGRRSRSSSTLSAMSSSSSGRSSFPPSSSSSSVGGGSKSTISSRVARQLSPFVGEGFLIHHVTKFDTLAGVAIKYGVEVADIRRCNALVSDVQMFARKVLRIPTPGPFPTCVSCESVCKPESSRPSSKAPSLEQQCGSLSSRGPSASSTLPLHSEVESRKGRRREAVGKLLNCKSISPAMGLLRGYYGLGKQGAGEGMELAVYKSDTEIASDDDEGLLSPMERRDVPVWEGKGHNRTGLSQTGTEHMSGGEISSLPPQRSLEEGGGGLGKTESGSWHDEDTFAGLATTGHPSSRRRASQSMQVVAVVEAISERTRATREMVQPAGAVGSVAGLDEALQGGIAEIVDEKLVRRKTVGSAKSASVADSRESFPGGSYGGVTGGRDNGDIVNEKGRRGFIPGRGPMPRPKSSSGERVGREDGLNLGSESGAGVRGKAAGEAAAILPPPLGPLNGWQNLDLGGFGSGKGGESGGSGISSLLSVSAVENLVMKVKRSASLPQIGVEDQEGDAEGGDMLSSIGKRRLSAGNLFGNWSNMGVVRSGLIDVVRAVGVNGTGLGMSNGSDFFGGKPPVSRRNKASVD